MCCEICPVYCPRNPCPSAAGGVCVPAGCEAIVHTVANCLEDPCIPRRQHTPSISAWMECCYGAQPLLHLSNHTILSSCGVQQGDPMGPLGFALALQPIVDQIKHEVPGLLVNACYLDDGTLCRSLDDLAAALSIIESEGPPRAFF